MHRNTLHHTATHCSTRHSSLTKSFHSLHTGWQTPLKWQIWAHCNKLQHNTAQYNTPQLEPTATHFTHWVAKNCHSSTHITTHCSALQHTATHCNTVQHNTIHCNKLHCKILQHTATHCSMTVATSYPHVDWKGLTTFARRKKVCVFSLLYIQKLGLSPKIPIQYSEMQLSLEIFTQVAWSLKIHKTPILCIEVYSKSSSLHPWRIPSFFL